MLTKKQKQILDYIAKCIKQNKYSPSLEEIGKHFKLSSVSTVHQHIETLREKGFLKKKGNQPRSIELNNKRETAGLIAIPLLGFIAAGSPIDVIENKETIKVPRTQLAKSGEHFALRVQGDSMIDEGIFDGDTVIVRKQNTVENGETAVALINDNEVTLKKIFREKNRIRLQPANPKLKPLYVKAVVIQGKVISAIRNLEEQEIREIKQIDEIKSQKPYFEKDGVSIFNEDILKITAIPENSIDLIITSPPYNVDIHYNSHADNLTYDDYLEFTQKWIKKCFNLAKNEGRFLLNIPLDKNKGGQKSVGADITKIAKDIGWKYHSTIIWNEGNISRRTAWGSFMSASAPYVIAPVELILVLYKDSWKKTGGSRENDITKQEFMNWTNGVWTFNGQSKKGAGGHPAPFPIELPKRCIKLFSFTGDTVLDPFLGSGSTLIATYLHNRKGIGIDIDKGYCDIAMKRLQQEAKIGQSNLIK